MGSYIYAVRSPSVKLKQFLTHEKIEVRQAKFVTRNSFSDSVNYEQIDRNYTKKGVATHIILSDDMKNLKGKTVYEYGSESGVFNDAIDLGSTYKAVGVILGKPRAWYIETRKHVIENIRRQEEFQKMKRGKLSIGGFGNDFHAYEEELHRRDKEAQAKGEDIYFRGYYIG